MYVVSSPIFLYIRNQRLKGNIRRIVLCCVAIYTNMAMYKIDM